MWYEDVLSFNDYQNFDHSVVCQLSERLLEVESAMMPAASNQISRYPLLFVQRSEVPTMTFRVTDYENQKCAWHASSIYILLRHHRHPLKT